ncbi:XTP/dITP diphosphatase [Bacillus kwashiorkori]|uniref:XTP/dITP diphosphatase n=1 Tax=Bacillus kwashiorkori TaxID=1522318 RepID=UPI0007857EFD|nr:XTP/dITP diphosphatase [Bacillus kwashiorkori]
MEIIIATKNPGKAKEFQEIFAPLGYEVKTLLDLKDIPDVEETGTTFAENAILKAEMTSVLLNQVVIADDSGLVIDALDGKPGVYSARYAGLEKNDDANIDKVLTELNGVPQENRTAHFHCTLAVAIPGQETKLFTGICNGLILTERRGNNGFGYDPIFYIPDLGKTMAELLPDEKNNISHRGQAIKQLRNWVNKHFKKGETDESANL